MVKIYISKTVPWHTPILHAVLIEKPVVYQSRRPHQRLVLSQIVLGLLFALHREPHLLEGFGAVLCDLSHQCLRTQPLQRAGRLNMSGLDVLNVRLFMGCDLLDVLVDVQVLVAV